MNKLIKTPINIREEKNILIEVIRTGKEELLNNKTIESLGVYLYYDNQNIYIGESSQPFRRLKQHIVKGKLCAKHKVIIFKSEQFNKSAIYNIETKLIEYMSVDRSKNLINTKVNQNDHQYFMKKNYLEVIPKIWDDLLYRGIAHQKISSIVEQNLYKFSPYKMLNKEQVQVVDSVTMNESANFFFISGYPGTGKSVICSTLLKKLSLDKKVAFISGTKGNGEAIKDIFKLVDNKKNIDFFSPSKLIKLKNNNRKYDFLIIDEAHRLKWANGHQYSMGIKHLSNGENELALLIKKARKTVILYDKNQILRDGDMPFDKINEIILNKSKIISFELKEQMRANKGSKFVEYIMGMLDGKNVNYRSSNLYEYKIFDKFEDMYKQMKKLSKKYELVRLTSGYTRKWNKKEDLVDFEIDGIKLKWNSKHTKWVYSDAAKNLEEIGYYDTVQGMDFNYNGVIIGKDIYLDENDKLQINEKYIVNQYDKTKKDDPNRYKKIRQFIINRYRVLLTRGVRGTFLYIEDLKLRKYLKKKIVKY